MLYNLFYRVSWVNNAVDRQCRCVEDRRQADQLDVVEDCSNHPVDRRCRCPPRQLVGSSPTVPTLPVRESCMDCCNSVASRTAATVQPVITNCLPIEPDNCIRTDGCYATRNGTILFFSSSCFLSQSLDSTLRCTQTVWQNGCLPSLLSKMFQVLRSLPSV